ncbi:MAG: Do family serine endopeptidase [Deltaproteobacteria bacterium]|nr:Do family serine endopeptidase [Deltaproteobacteria bacterium]
MKKIIFTLVSFLFLNSAHAAWFDGRPTSFAALAKQVKPAVVNISTTKTVKRQPMRAPRSPFGQQDPFEEFRRFFEEGGGGGVPREEEQHSLGTGFVISKEGDILTNNHVVGDADEIIVKLSDGRKFKASVVGRDERSDIAIIKIQAKELLPFAKLGDSDLAEPGDWVMAVGNPFGFEHTVTVGVISAKGRVIGDAKAPFAKFIQTDASINPGNSGGPLFNINGEVIGVNTMIYGMGTGIGFAIPINLAKEEIPQLISKGSVTRGWLGVQIQRLTPELAESYGLLQEQGALIGSVYPSSPAESSGLKRGDIVVEYDGKKIEDPFDLSAYVAQGPIGKVIKLKVLRQGKEMMLEAKIGKRQEEEQAAAAKPEAGKPEAALDILGMAVRAITPDESRRLNLPPAQQGGVLIDQVQPGSAAEDHDIRAGDILLEINDTKIGTAADYDQTVKKLKKGSIVRLLVGRGPMTIFVAFKI